MRNKVLLIIPLLVLLIACNLQFNFINDEQDEVVVENDTENNVAIDNTQVSNVNQTTAIDLTEEERIRETEVAPTVGTPISPTNIPYGVSVDYAGAIYNEELRFTVAEGKEFGAYERAQFLFALNTDQETFYLDEDMHYIHTISYTTYRILALNPVAEVLLGKISPQALELLPEGFEEAYNAAKENDSDSFEFENVFYRITLNRKNDQISTEENIALASLDIFSPYNEEDLPIVDSFEFKLSAEKAIRDNLGSFTQFGQTFTVNQHNGYVIINDLNNQPFALISQVIVNPVNPDEFLTVELKILVIQSIENGVEEFSYTDTNGTTFMYHIARVNANYYIQRYEPFE